MTFLQKGDIVLALFPFSDLSQTKLRPAVVLWADEANQDITICFVSSQGINQVSADEFVLQPSDSEFMATGLKVVSKVRVTKIVTLARKLITRRLGNLENTYIAKLNQTMIRVFKLDSGDDDAQK
jgi:mRNA interferase MazF